MSISRRNILKLGASTAALWATKANLWAGQPETRKSKIPIGLQLYSLREDCPKDLPGVLQAVAKMGYAAVEFAGYHKRSAAELRKMLDDNGLKCCGTHTGLDTLTGDAFQATVEFNKTIGNRFLIVPSLPPANMLTAEDVKKTAKLFTDLAKQAQALDMRVGYHAHAGDLRELDGTTPWDMFFTTAGPNVIMQLDTANCLAGGGDPVAILKKFPGRAVSIHLKEHGGKKGAVIGEGAVKWKEVLEICETTGGTEWYVVEQEEYAAAPLESVKQCLENLHKMGK